MPKQTANATSASTSASSTGRLRDLAVAVEEADRAAVDQDRRGRVLLPREDVGERAAVVRLPRRRAHDLPAPAAHDLALDERVVERDGVLAERREQRVGARTGDVQALGDEGPVAHAREQDAVEVERGRGHRRGAVADLARGAEVAQPDEHVGEVRGAGGRVRGDGHQRPAQGSVQPLRSAPAGRISSR